MSVDIFEISLFVPLFPINRNFKGSSCYSTSIVRAGAIRSTCPYIMMYAIVGMLQFTVDIQDDVSVLGCMFITMTGASCKVWKILI
jgi:hypothetical protein